MYLTEATYVHLYFAVLALSWENSDYAVGEGDGQATVCLQLRDVLAPTETDIWVSILVVDSSTVAGIQ